MSYTQGPCDKCARFRSDDNEIQHCTTCFRNLCDECWNQHHGDFIDVECFECAEKNRTVTFISGDPLDARVFDSLSMRDNPTQGDEAIRRYLTQKAASAVKAAGKNEEQFLNFAIAAKLVHWVLEKVRLVHDRLESTQATVERLDTRYALFQKDPKDDTHIIRYQKVGMIDLTGLGNKIANVLTAYQMLEKAPDEAEKRRILLNMAKELRDMGEAIPKLIEEE